MKGTKNVDNLTVIDEIHKLTFEQLTIVYRLYSRETRQLDYQMLNKLAPTLEKKGLLEKIEDEPGWRIPKGLFSDFEGSATELNDLWTHKNEAIINQRIKEENKNKY